MSDDSPCLAVTQCCAPTVALVEALREPRRCPVCQRHHAADLDVTLVRQRPPVPRRPGLDLRDGDVPAPSRPREAAPTEGRGHDQVRALLCELRPDRGGPFGWGVAAQPPELDEPTLGALANRIRVQCTEEVPSILPGAFASAAQTVRGAMIARLLELTVDRLTDEAARAQGDAVLSARASLRGARALVWLQRRGTLAWGLDVLHHQLAHALSDEARRARWRSAGAGAARGAVVWGASCVDQAISVWQMLTPSLERV